MNSERVVLNIVKSVIAARGIQVQRKDKDLMRDTGGISKGRDREPDFKPPRDDVKERYRDKRLKPSDRDKDRADKTSSVQLYAAGGNVMDIVGSILKLAFEVDIDEQTAIAKARKMKQPVVRGVEHTTTNKQTKVVVQNRIVKLGDTDVEVLVYGFGGVSFMMPMRFMKSKSNMTRPIEILIQPSEKGYRTDFGPVDVTEKDRLLIQGFKNSYIGGEKSAWPLHKAFEKAITDEASRISGMMDEAEKQVEAVSRQMRENPVAAESFVKEHVGGKKRIVVELKDMRRDMWFVDAWREYLDGFASLKGLEKVAPREFMDALRGVGKKYVKGIADAVANGSPFTMKVVRQSGGDRARSGNESGLILSVNERIKESSRDNPGGSETVKQTHEWDMLGNVFRMGTYEESWTTLD